MKPRESKDDVFLATAHDVKEVFLGNSFDVGIEGTGVPNSTCFVHNLIYIVNCDEGGKLLGEESVFPDELPVDTRDVDTRIY